MPEQENNKQLTGGNFLSILAPAEAGATGQDHRNDGSKNGKEPCHTKTPRRIRTLSISAIHEQAIRLRSRVFRSAQ